MIDPLDDPPKYLWHKDQDSPVFALLAVIAVEVLGAIYRHGGRDVLKSILNLI